jgi:hypothetical protein
MVDYEALTGLSLLRVPQTIRMAGGAMCIDNAPDTSLMTMSRTFRCRMSQGKGIQGVCTVATSGSHCIDDPPNMGPYIQQDNIQFYHTVCKCTNNIREVIG